MTPLEINKPRLAWIYKLSPFYI